MARTVKNTKKRKKSEIFIYHRLLRYPCFPVVAKGKIIHELKRGTVTIINRNATITDAQRLFSIIKLISEQRVEIQHAAYRYDDEIDEISIVKIAVKDIVLSEVKTRNDYLEIFESIEKISTVSIIYKDSDSVTVLKPIVKATLDKENVLTIHFQKVFLDACLYKLYFNRNISLCIDYDMFVSLNKHTKNLYLFLQAHRDKKFFNIETLLNRCLYTYTISSTKDAVKKLKKSLNELKEKNYIKKFYFRKKQVFIQY